MHTVTLDEAYYRVRSQELNKELISAQKQIHACLDDKKSERLDELKKLIGIMERTKPINEFDKIMFGQTVKQIAVLSETEIRFELIGEVSFMEKITR